MSETTSGVVYDERVSSETRKFLSVLCHLAHFVENHPDAAIRCTLEDIVNFPAGDGVWGNPSVDAWLRSEDNPYRPASDGGNSTGSCAVKALRRDYGKRDYQ